LDNWKFPWKEDQHIERPLPTITQQIKSPISIDISSGIRNHKASVRTVKTIRIVDRVVTEIGSITKHRI